MNTMNSVPKPVERIHFLDNLRTFLIFLVIVYHSGGVYESSGFWAPFWIIDDPATNDLVGILNLVIDIFVMSLLFYVSGYFAPNSLASKQPAEFIRAKLRRLMLPWLLAVLFLMPLYKVLFLYSRGLPQQEWTTYLYWNSGFSQSWLWYLPILFLFDMIYLGLSRLSIRTANITMMKAVPLVFIIGLAYSFGMAVTGNWGWTLTPLFDFQNERLLIYFMIFLLGALSEQLNLFGQESSTTKLYIAINATSWIPILGYLFFVLLPFIKPGAVISTPMIDEFFKWVFFHLALLSLIYLNVVTFRNYFNRQGKLAAMINANSYNVYIVHIIVMGVIGLGLLNVQLNSLGKWVVLTVGTWLVSNLIAGGYRRYLKPIMLR
jgi:fucose 4-O-acetylase-like acetyltransferase